MLTKDQLVKIMPYCRTPDVFIPLINDALKLGEINSVLRVSAFLGQIALESGELKYMREIWGNPPSFAQQRYERNFNAGWPPTPQDQTNKLAFKLGNNQKDDGFNFRGWGPLQITGRSNTLASSMYIYNDDRLTTTPALLNEPGIGLKGAVWYWVNRKLNSKADIANYADITQLINGGMTHHDKRIIYYLRALNVLGSVSPPFYVV